MKTQKRKWEVIPEEKLSVPAMLRVRGGDGNGEEDPGGPIVKGP